MSKQYCVMARFTGPIYHDRKYKGIVTSEMSSILTVLQKAKAYYEGNRASAEEYRGCEIWEREVGEWEKTK